MKRIAPLIFAAVVVLSCTNDQPPTTAPFANAPQATILDGANGGGNPHFFWLPELVELPTYTGTFNPDLPARIEICRLTGAEPTEPADPVACVVGTEQVLFAAAEVSIDPVNERYSAVWKTDDQLPSGDYIDSNYFYRLSVWVGDFELGQRDLDPEDSPPSGSGGKVALFYPFKLGNTINIKFRIEAGAFCLSGDPENCGECFYSTSGAGDGNNDEVGRACNATGQHGVYIPAGNEAINNVLVIPERIVGTVTLDDGRTLNCTPDDDPSSPTFGQVNFIKGLDVPQYPGCFFVRTIPELETNLQYPAVVGSCPEIPADAPDRLAVIARTDDANNPSYVQALRPASTVIDGVDFLNCDEPLSPLQSFAQAVKKLNPFYAGPVEAGSLGTLKGGDTPSFSDFVWMVPSQEEKTAGDGQVGLTGMVLPTPLTVYVSDDLSGAAASNFRAVPNIAVAGATVTFTATDVGLSFPAADNTCGFGSANTLDVTTGLSGEAKVCVTLPSTVGTYNVFASGFGIGVKGESWSINSVSGTGPYSHWNATSLEGGPITLPASPVELAFEVTACQPGVGSATADGVLEPGEYQCSEDPVPFEANVGGGKTTGYIYRMQSDGTLYFAVAIPVSEQQSLKTNTLTLYLNTDGATELAAGHDVLIVDGTLPAGQQFSDNFWTTDCPKGQSFCAVNDTNASPAGTKDGSGGFGLNTGENGLFYFYEISHPLNGPDVRDIKYTSTLHAFFTIRGLGKGNKGDTEFPGPFGVYDQLEP